MGCSTLWGVHIVGEKCKLLMYYMRTATFVDHMNSLKLNHLTYQSTQLMAQKELIIQEF